MKKTIAKKLDVKILQLNHLVRQNPLAKYGSPSLRSSPATQRASFSALEHIHTDLKAAKQTILRWQFTTAVLSLLLTFTKEVMFSPCEYYVFIQRRVLKSQLEQCLL